MRWKWRWIKIRIVIVTFMQAHAHMGTCIWHIHGSPSQRESITRLLCRRLSLCDYVDYQSHQTEHKTETTKSDTVTMKIKCKIKIKICLARTIAPVMQPNTTTTSQPTLSALFKNWLLSALSLKEQQGRQNPTDPDPDAMPMPETPQL